MILCKNECGKSFSTNRGERCHYARCVNPIPFEDLKKDHTRKVHLLRERERKCEVCNNTTWNDLPIPIELDHIDGNPEHNSRENLRLICPNCHAQTETYKGRNMGKVTNSKRSQEMKKYYGLYR